MKVEEGLLGRVLKTRRADAKNDRREFSGLQSREWRFC
jgi:hypothetical protein